MVTITEVVGQIIEYTARGDLKWTPCEWGESGEANYWICDWHDCTFVAELPDGVARMSVYSPGITGAVVIGEREEVGPLIGILREMFNIPKTPVSTALLHAYDRLTNFPRSARK